MLLLAIVSCFGCADPAPRYPDALEPEAALERFELRDGFRMELFAAEPFVRDPVELVFDERGRAFAVEMPDYPYKPERGRQRSRVKLLEDTDGDGRVDRARIFADTLSEATSAMPWRGGLIVTAAPYIYYLKDTDGDDVADEREVLFSGFFDRNSEAQITNLRFNVDNWIYASNFGQPGSVSFNRQPEAPPLDVLGCDFRFRLDTGQFECAAGPTQFGQAIDDGGRRLATHNTQHINQLVIPWRYLHRHDALPNNRSLVNISDHELRMFQRTPAPYWRAERTERRQKRYTEEGLDRVEYAADHFTGSSGGTYYDGDLFPASYYGNVFTGDVAGNLVHRDLLVDRPGSPVFAAQRASDEQDREFLATTDSWFRPASFTVGPDGALYVVDFYRQHIETPLSIPEDLKEDMDFYAGEDRGRIYRIVPEGRAAERVEVDLAGASTGELIDLLSHANGWFRRTAHRLLIERGERSEEQGVRSEERRVREVFESSRSPQARLRALSVLEGWGVVQPADIRSAMQDEGPDVRLHAARMAESCRSCWNDLVTRAEEEDARVAMQAALSLGSISFPGATEALARTAARYYADPWMRLAILSSEEGSSPEMLGALAARSYFQQRDASRDLFVQELGEVIGRRNDTRQVETWLAFWSNDAYADWRQAGLAGLAEGLIQHRGSVELSGSARAALDGMRATPDDSVHALADSILGFEGNR